ncbi:MAG: hypothetical protein WC624_00310 [Candidatus Margulisiibacteriota bacterium]
MTGKSKKPKNGTSHKEHNKKVKFSNKGVMRGRSGQGASVVNCFGCKAMDYDEILKILKPNGRKKKKKKA